MILFDRKDPGNAKVGDKLVRSELRDQKNSGEIIESGVRKESTKSGRLGRLKHSPPNEVMLGDGFAGKDEEKMGLVLVGRNRTIYCNLAW